MAEDKEPNSKPKRDSRLDAFLTKAAPIIAVERGLTPACRIKLESIAQDMKLPPELFEKGLAKLQEGPVNVAKKSRWERAFQNYLETNLSKVKNGILTIEVEQKATRVAEEKYQLTRQQAKEILVEVAQKLKLRRISATEAERHVEATIREMIGTSVWVDIDTKLRLYSLGEEWGVTKEHVEGVITYYTQRNKEKGGREQRWSGAIVATVTILVLMGLGGFFYWNYQNNKEIEKTEAGTGSESKGAGKKANGELQIPKWWTEDAKAALAHAMQNRKFMETNSGIVSEDPNTRLDAYNKLGLEILNAYDRPNDAAKARDLMVVLLIDEPDQAVFQGAADHYLQNLTPAKTGLPSEGQFYRMVLEGLKYPVELFIHKRISPERKTVLRGKLDQSMRNFSAIPVDTAEVLKKYQKDLCAVLWDHLVEHGASVPNRVGTFAKDLDSMSRTVGMDPDTILEQKTRLLIQLMRGVPTEWKNYKELISHVIVVTNKENLAEFLAAYEVVADEELSEYLRETLQGNLKLSFTSTIPSEIASEVRRSLGITRTVATTTQAARWNSLLLKSQTSLEVARPESPTSAEAVQRIQHVAYCTTLVARLANEVRIDEQFDKATQNFSEVGKKEEGEGTAVLPIEDRSAVEQARLLGIAINRLMPERGASLEQRNKSLDDLSDLASVLPDISTAEAKVLARYACAPRTTPEERKLLPALSYFASWPNFLLAVVDVLEEAKLEQTRAEMIVAKILSLDVVVHTDLDWKTSLQQMLLARALETIQSSGGVAAGADGKEVTGLANFLRDQFQHRAANLRGSILEVTNDTLSPAESLEEELRALRDAIRAKGKVDENWEREFQGELEIARYLSKDDLHRTALLDALAVRTTGKLILLTKASLKPQVKTVLDDFQKASREAPTVIDQVYAAEAASLRLWILLKE